MNDKSELCFFAAANGYSGFRSYFDSIYKSEEFDKIYVLKGGPGTGKSTLLKQIAKHCKESDRKTESILCSSDVNSLDGVIISSRGHHVAILDGTAPHERDAKVPIACDVLINLAEGLNEKEIREHRDEIFALNEKKSAAYKRGYEQLALCGVFEEKIRAVSGESGKRSDACAYGEIVDMFRGARKGDLSKRLVRAFGAGGLITLPTLSKFAERTIVLDGERSAKFALMSRLYRNVLDNGYEATVFPDVFKDDDIYALYLPANDLLITTDTVKNPLRIIRIGEAQRRSDHGLSELIDFQKKLYTYAEECFKEAADYHFALERIYVGAMNFERNASITRGLIASIDEIFA